MKFEARVLAALLVCAVAELHVSRGEQQSGPLHNVQKQDCAVIGWAQLCGQNLTAGSCFQLQPGSVAGRCQLQGPPRGAAQLRSARPDHVTTLQTSGELRVTGRIQMISLRFEAGTLSFEDAEVDACHEVPSDLEESIKLGGAFYARNGSFTLSRSKLKVRNTGAVNGGGFAVAGDLRVRQNSQVFIQNVSAKMNAAGFLVSGNAEIYEGSLIFIHNARAGKHGGGFSAGDVVIAGGSILNITGSSAESGEGGGFYNDKLNVSSGSTVVICNATAVKHGGGFSADDVVIAGGSTLNITNSRAESGEGGGFYNDKLNVSSGSTVVICNAAAEEYGGGFSADDVVIADRSTLNIANSHAESGGGFDSYNLNVSSGSSVVICNATAEDYGGGFSADDVVIADRSTLNITNSHAESGGGFDSYKLNVSSGSTVVISNATAAEYGGGFCADGEVAIAGGSTLNITNSHAESASGGGFFSTINVTVSTSSTIVISNATAGTHGGGFYTKTDVVIADRSTLKITNTRAGSEFGGGFFSRGNVTVSSSSSVWIGNATAERLGGGFWAERQVVIAGSSILNITNCGAADGGGFLAGDVVIADRSTLNITNSRAESGDGGGFSIGNKLIVSSNSTVVISNATAGKHGGGFWTESDVVIAGGSILNITDSRAESGEGGGFYNGKLNVSRGSTVVICNATAGKHGGGFFAFGEVVIADGSILNITNSRAAHGGGFRAGGEVVIAGGSTLNITNSRAESGDGGGFKSEKKLTVSRSSRLGICSATAGSFGGGFRAGGEVVIAGGSTLNITNSRAESGDGGGFYSRNNVSVSTSSTIVICNARAGAYGGGFRAGGEVVIAGKSNISISNGRAVQQGGGFQVHGRLRVNNSSAVSLQNVTAGQHGGGFFAYGEVAIAGRSTLKITNSVAESQSGSGGGFYSNSKLTLSSSSTLRIWNAKAGMSGAGFLAMGKVAITRSALRIQYARAMKSGGGFITSDNVVIAEKSSVSISNGRADQQGGGFQADGRLHVNDSSIVNLENVTAGQHGGGFVALKEVAIAGRSTLNITNSRAESGSGGGFHILKDLFLHGSVLSINKSKALHSGTGGRVDGQVLLASESNLGVHKAEGPQDSSVLAASCLHLHVRSNILFEGVFGGYGMDLQNDCKKNGGLCRSTLEVAPDAIIHATGRLASGLLSVAGCHSEKIHLTGIYLQAWSSPLLSTRGNPGHVVVDQVRIDYEAPVNNLPVLAVEDGYSIDSMIASCGDCAHGVTFNTAKDGKQLLAFSPQNLQCPETATVSNGYTTRCECGNSQITRPDFRDKKMVLLENTFQTCMFCERHYYFQNGVCQKCELLSAWSDGRKDFCHTWPLERTESLLLFLGPAAVVLTIFIAWEIITAPLTIVEAKSTMADDEKGTRTFTFSVQGPIVHLHKSLSRLVHGRISYRVQGTNLDWLDYNQNSQKVVKVSSLGGRKLILENLAVPFDCGACKGSLQATDFSFPFIALTGLVTVVVMLPIVISIAATSGNELEHIVVTATLAILPMALVALVLHVPVAWLLRRSYHRTPFREALGHYEKQIQCTPYSGPDADHPYNHGLQAVTLRGFWQHFEGFILEYNMHFVVSNLVRPLTKSRQISFVDLWGGRRVDYFVSHSWITGFRHFVRSIHCHALSNDGPAWTDAAYWICSFANNQWNIAAELGTDPMSSAFARVLTHGPREVAMVLDKEVQPLTRVWCLFEFLLASRNQVHLVFVTDDGVVGTDGCRSFDIALEMGKKIKSLQVATCHASSEKDKKDIFNYIVSELGSLECMDEQIRSLMGDMLVNNLTNVGRATEDLLKELGQKKTLSYQGSARVEALSSFESSELPAP